MNGSHVQMAASAHGHDGLGNRRNSCLGRTLVLEARESLLDPYAADERAYWIPCARFGLARRAVIERLCKSRTKLKRCRPDRSNMAFASRRGER